MQLAKFISEFIELGRCILRFWQGSRQLMLEKGVYSILKGVPSKTFSGENPRTTTAARFARSSLLFLTARNMATPLAVRKLSLSTKGMCVCDKKVRPKAMPTSRQIESLHPPSLIPLATALRLILSLKLFMLKSETFPTMV